MREIIRICYKHDLELSTEVREYLKKRPKEPETGIYKGN